ncbi:hypothetical protein BUE93_05730 [Chromobacterium amazonense]|uniref:Uncharacterized protein n=1 Tax=Chromobacterium amazonense TaxID=1382803 RepID=A0A2S9X704_9NEIS|nr:hypothetical protein [Chromobacterium amazonense]PRP71498.1 hypothetical protein BUE93_05730 [Chromobacterium amazonense]
MAAKKPDVKMVEARVLYSGVLSGGELDGVRVQVNDVLMVPESALDGDSGLDANPDAVAAALASGGRRIAADGSVSQANE